MKQNPKTLFIFSPAFPADEKDTEWLPWLHTLVTAFNRNFPAMKVIVFAFQYPNKTQSYQWHNNTIIPLNGMHKKKHQRLLIWWKIFTEVKKLKKSNNVIGILSIWCGECTFVAKHLSKIFNLKYYCWIVGQDARKTNNYVKRIKPKAESLVAMSDFLADEFYRNHHVKPKHFIPNGTDSSLFNQAITTKDIDVIGVGSLSRLKQYDIFLRIADNLKKVIPDIKVALCGDGEERKNVAHLAEKLNLKNTLTLMGYVKHTEGLQLMQRSKILLHPSSYEGFATVCIEALYAGAHVISFVKPMHNNIQNWHIVKTEAEMYSTALQLLKNHQTKYESVLVYSINDNAKAFINLFGIHNF